MNCKTSAIQDIILDEHADLLYITRDLTGQAERRFFVSVVPTRISNPQADWLGVWVAVIFCESIALSSWSCLAVSKCTSWNKFGILLLYCSPYCPTVSILELAEVVSALMLGLTWATCWDDFNVCAKTLSYGAEQECMVFMIAIVLLQLVHDPTSVVKHTLRLHRWWFGVGGVENNWWI